MRYVRDVSEPGQFEQVIADPEWPAFVDFWRDGCGTCRAMAPILERLARQYDGRIAFVKLNVNEFPEIGRRFGVHSIPTLMILRGRKVAMRLSGFRPEATLRPYLGCHALPEPQPAARATTEPAPPGSGLTAFLRRRFDG